MSVIVVGAFHGRQNEIVDFLSKAFHITNANNSTWSDVTTRSDEEQQCPSNNTSSDINSITKCHILQEQYLVLPSHHRQDVIVAMSDNDLSMTQICFEFFSPLKKSNSIDYIRQDIIRRLMMSILDRRFNELHKQHNGNVPSDLF
jgi:hypothetical protein